MTDTPPKKQEKPKQPYLGTKAKARAANLRANLSRRKEQIRSREESGTPEPDC